MSGDYEPTERDLRRVYDWVVRQQRAGRRVAALEPDDWAYLAAAPDLHGERAYLADLTEPPHRAERAAAGHQDGGGA
jgi:hypothetical protein